MADDRRERERFGLGEDGALIHYEHAHRYLLAAELARGRRVLDLACGSGYGSHALRKAGLDVISLDLDRECARNAQPAVSARGEALPFADRSFECVVCFEAIEHVSDPELIIAEIARVLESDGIALISTPNRPLYSEHSKRINPYHLRELDRSEFSAMLGRHFEHSDLFAQSVWAGSWIAPENSTAAQAARLRMLQLPEELTPPSSPAAPWAATAGSSSANATMQPAPLYFFAICGHSRKRISKLARKSHAAHLLHDPEQRLIGEMLAAQHAATDRGAEVASQERHSLQIGRDLASAHVRIASLEENDRNLSADLERERTEHTALRTHVTNLEADTTRAVARAAELTAHVGNVQGLLAAEREAAAGAKAHAANLERLAEERSAALRNLEAHVANLEATREGANLRIRELEAHTANVESISAGRDERIRELEAHTANVESISAGRDERIRELEAHAANLERLADERSAALRSLEAHVSNLEATRESANLRIRELEAHTANVESISAERGERVRELEAHTLNLDAASTERGERIRKLEEHSGNVERIVEQRSERIAGLEAHATNLEAALSNESARAEASAATAEALAGRARELETELAESRRMSQILQTERRQLEAARNSAASERDGLRRQLNQLRSSLGVRVLRRLRLLRDAAERTDDSTTNGETKGR